LDRVSGTQAFQRGYANSGDSFLKQPEKTTHSRVE